MAMAIWTVLFNNTGRAVCLIATILNPVRVSILWEGTNSSYERY